MNTPEDKQEDEDVQEIKPYSYIQQTLTRNVHHFYISSFIGPAEHYVEMINKIQIALPDDIIYIHLNTVGGYMATGLQIINAMRTSQAHVICSIESEVSSLGTMIFLAGDEFVVHDNCLLMFHNYSGSVVGKAHEQIAAIESAKIWTRDFLMRIYVPFMNEDEVDRLIKGEDLYMHPPEIRERLDNMLRGAEEEAVKQTEENEKKQRTTKKKTSKKTTSKK